MPETRLSLSDVAKVVVDDFNRGNGGAVTPIMAVELAGAIELALLTALRDERRACVAECTWRAELWDHTGDKPETSDPLRAEAWVRAAEARVLADLLAARP